jgi:hypothetical protein
MKRSMKMRKLVEAMMLQDVMVCGVLEDVNGDEYDSPVMLLSDLCALGYEGIGEDLREEGFHGSSSRQRVVVVSADENHRHLGVIEDGVFAYRATMTAREALGWALVSSASFRGMELAEFLDLDRLLDVIKADPSRVDRLFQAFGVYDSPAIETVKFMASR